MKKHQSGPPQEVRSTAQLSLMNGGTVKTKTPSNTEDYCLRHISMIRVVSKAKPDYTREQVLYFVQGSFGSAISAEVPAEEWLRVAAIVSAKNGSPLPGAWGSFA